MSLLGGMDLLEWVWPCKRKCVTVKVDLVVSYDQATPSATGSPCTNTTMFSVMMIRVCWVATTKCFHLNGMLWSLWLATANHKTVTYIFKNKVSCDCHNINTWYYLSIQYVDFRLLKEAQKRDGYFNITPKE